MPLHHWDMERAGVTAVLVSHQFNLRWGAQLREAATQRGLPLTLVPLPAEAEGRIAEQAAAAVDVAFFTSDVFPAHAGQFFSATRKTPRLKWMQLFNAGIDHPVFASLLARGVKLTTAAGVAARPIAQTAITGLLLLARNFSHWLDAQHAKRWAPRHQPDLPRELQGQVALVYGLGQIGKEFAKLAQALGLHVIGARRSGRQADDPVDEFVLAADFRRVLPRCDWLVLTCPLSPDTQGLIDAATLVTLKRGAQLINVGRGEVVVEPAMIDALGSGQLGGAYLDVFATEPLPLDSPLWAMPNVYLTPHNAAASDGNEPRLHALFLDNLQRFRASQPLRNEVHAI